MAPTAVTSQKAVAGSGSAANAALRSQASRLLDAGDAERSKLVLEAALQADRSDVQARLLLTNVCLELTPPNFEEALEVARQALAVAGRSSRQDVAQVVSCKLGVAVALGASARRGELPEQQRANQRAEAVQLLQAAESAASPTLQPLLQYNLALLLAESGEVDQAVQHARSALQGCTRGGAGTSGAGVVVSVVDPDGFEGREAALKVQQLSTLCLVLLALLLSSRQQPQSALQLLTAAPEPPTAGEGASTALAAAAALHPSSVLLARVRAALLHGRLGDTAGAMAQLARHKLGVAKALEGEGAGMAQVQVQLMTQVWRDLALLCADSDNSSEACFCIDQALQLNPCLASIHHTLGQVYEAAGRPEAAQEAYNTALALDPCDAGTLLSLGALYRRRGSVPDLALARDFLSEAVRHQPTTAAAWYQLGLACRGLGHRKEAERNLHAAVVLAAAAPALPFSECPLLLQV